jgi:hypothetical protein
VAQVVGAVTPGGAAASAIGSLINIAA